MAFQDCYLKWLGGLDPSSFYFMTKLYKIVFIHEGSNIRYALITGLIQEVTESLAKVGVQGEVIQTSKKRDEESEIELSEIDKADLEEMTR